jgi:hypothetical protein
VRKPFAGEKPCLPVKSLFAGGAVLFDDFFDFVVSGGSAQLF